MVKAVDPKPRENLLQSPDNSRMQFMKEYLIYDSENESYIRFRGMYIMPNWDGVEENEFDYVVEHSWTTLYQIAVEFYGDPVLMDVIAARNHMDLPDIQIYRGQVLKIPSKSWVRDKLLPQGGVLRRQD